LLQNPYDITQLTLGMSLHYLGKFRIQIFYRYSADMEENANRLHFECTDFYSSTRVTVCWVYLCVNRIFEIFKHMEAWLFSFIKCGWLWKELVTVW